MRYLKTLRRVSVLPALLIIVIINVLASSTVAAAAIAKGYQANGNPQSDTTALLGRFGELIARERAYADTAYELEKSARGDSAFEMDNSMLDAVLGKNFYQLYDEVLPKLEALGQQSRRDELALRFEPEAQKQLIAGKRVAGINDGAIAIDKLGLNLIQ